MIARHEKIIAERNTQQTEELRVLEQDRRWKAGFESPKIYPASQTWRGARVVAHECIVIEKDVAVTRKDTLIMLDEMGQHSDARMTGYTLVEGSDPKRRCVVTVVVWNGESIPVDRGSFALAFRPRMDPRRNKPIIATLSVCKHLGV